MVGVYCDVSYWNFGLLCRHYILQTELVSFFFNFSPKLYRIVSMWYLIISHIFFYSISGLCRSHSKNMWGEEFFVIQHAIISMASCKTAVTALLMHWSYCSLVLSHWYAIHKQRVMEGILLYLGRVDTIVFYGSVKVWSHFPQNAVNFLHKTISVLKIRKSYFQALQSFQMFTGPFSWVWQA